MKSEVMGMRACTWGERGREGGGERVGKVGDGEG